MKNEDKILNNRYNRLEIDFDELKEFKIDSEILEYLFVDNNFFENYFLTKLEEIIYEEAKNEKIDLNKKINENDIEELIIFFHKLYLKIDKKIYDELDYFFTFVNFFGIKNVLNFYKKLFPVFRNNFLNMIYKKFNIKKHVKENFLW